MSHRFSCENWHLEDEAEAPKLERLISRIGGFGGLKKRYGNCRHFFGELCSLIFYFDGQAAAIAADNVDASLHEIFADQELSPTSAGEHEPLFAGVTLALIFQLCELRQIENLRYDLGIRS